VAAAPVAGTFSASEAEAEEVKALWPGEPVHESTPEL